MADEQAQTASARRGRLRTIIAVVLLSLGLVVALAANLTVWTKDTLLDTNEWVATVKPLPADDRVSAALADLIVDELTVATEDLQAQARAALPPEAQFLTEPILAGLQRVLREEAMKLIQSEQFTEIWVRVNRLAQEQLVAILRGENNQFLQTSGGEVRLDFSDAVLAVREQLGADGQQLIADVPEDAGVIVIASSEQLSKAQDAVSLLDALGVVLPLLATAMLLGSIAVAVGRRRFLLAAGVGLAIVAAITLIALDVLRGELLGLINDEVVRSAGEAAFEITTDGLRSQTIGLLILGLLLAVAAWVAGPNRYAVLIREYARQLFNRARRAAEEDDRLSDLEPVSNFVRAHRGVLQLGGVVVALIVLIVWNQPSWVTVLVTACLLAVYLGVMELLAPRRRGGGGAPAG